MGPASAAGGLSRAARVAAEPTSSSRSGSRYAYELARPEDDAAIRVLLRAQPMGGAVRLSLEREPSFAHAAAIEGPRHHAFVLRDLETGSPVALACRSARRLWVNGEPRWVGYLGQLRRAPELRGQIRHLAAGFAACEATRQPDELAYDLTSIAADNTAARGLLEKAGTRLRGVPLYQPYCEMVTLMIPMARGRKRAPEKCLAPGEKCPEKCLAPIVDCLARNGRRHAFSPVWTLGDLAGGERCPGLRPEDFFVRRAASGSDTAGPDARVTACLARWDQTACKQAVVRGYGRTLGRFRWLVNTVGSLVGVPPLPAVGQPLRFAYLSHIAVDGDDGEVLADLVEEARRAPSRPGQELDALVLGLAASSPMLPVLLRRFRPRSYRTVIYRVLPARKDEARAATSPPGIPHLEVAVL